MNYFYGFDIFSRRISFFYNNQEKLGSYFGLFLTALYIIISLVLFIYNLFSTLQRKNLKVYDSSFYAQEMPQIELDKNLFYFAFGLEDPKTSSRFIDETIYYPEVLFIDRIKINGNFKTIVKKSLPLENCKEKNFGQNYQHLLIDGELNTSYCLKDFDYNITFAGGYKYEKMTYLRIKIFPCRNTTENHNHCKSREEIDYYFTSSYFSILMKDIGLNPSNFTHPILPTLQDLYTTVDRRLYRNYILNFGLTEIHTDVGLFHENIKKDKYIQFRKELDHFSLLEEEQYLGGNEICLVQIRLDDTILFQKRSYTKISEILSLIGGYMQLMYTIFLLISLLIIKVDSELKIINSIFNFNLKKNKLILKFRNLQTLNTIKITQSFKNLIITKKENRNMSKTIDSENNNNKTNQNLITNNYNNINIIRCPLKINMPNNDTNIIIEKQYSHKLKLNGKNNIIPYFENQNNKSIKSNPNLHLKEYNRSSNENLNKNFFANFNKRHNQIFNDYPEYINLTIFEYLSPCKNKKKKKMFELYYLGKNFYRKRMDIVFIFSHLLLTEKMLVKNNFYHFYPLFNQDDFENS